MAFYKCYLSQAIQRRLVATSLLWRNKRRGVAAIEFAIVLPLLISLALAACDFGRIAHFQQVVANAARTGAETGATQQYTSYSQGDWEESIRESVVNELSSLEDFVEGDMTFDLTTTKDADDITQIAVNVSYPFSTVVSWPFIPAEVVLHSHVEYRQYR